MSPAIPQARLAQLQEELRLMAEKPGSTSITQIAHKHRCCYETVRQLAKTIGIKAKRGPVPDASRVEAIDRVLRENPGASRREQAKLAGAEPYMVSIRARAIGLRRKEAPSDSLIRAVELHLSELNYQEIAEVLECSRQNVGRALQHARMIGVTVCVKNIVSDEK